MVPSRLVSSASNLFANDSEVKKFAHLLPDVDIFTDIESRSACTILPTKTV
jgi:hypothetical protein